MASVDNHDDEKVTNPYLAMREAKIARNQKRLSDLGLLKPPPPPPPPRTTKQQPIPTRHQHRSVPVRRSSRLSSLEQEKHSDDRERELLPSAGKRARDTPDTDTVSVARKSRSNAPTNAPPPPQAANSVRSISLDVDYLILGHNKDHRDGLLGKMVERTGKDYVIHKSFAKAAYLEDRQRLTGVDRKLSFNKYSGVQEWKVRATHSFLSIYVTLSTVLTRCPIPYRLHDFPIDRIAFFFGSTSVPTNPPMNS